MDCGDVLRANIELFGEPVTVVFDNAVRRVVSGIVNRQPISPMPEVPEVHRPKFQVTLLNSATEGVTFAERMANRLKLGFPEYPGAIARDWPVAPGVVSCADDAMILEI
jgi:hypothetical protein